MKHSVLETIQSSKFFYVRTYRLGIKVLGISILINVFLLLSLRYLYLTKPEPDFYATDGVTPPIKLAPRSSPNYSSVALLPKEEVVPETKKPIPK